MGYPECKSESCRENCSSVPISSRAGASNNRRHDAKKRTCIRSFHGCRHDGNSGRVPSKEVRWCRDQPEVPSACHRTAHGGSQRQPNVPPRLETSLSAETRHATHNDSGDMETEWKRFRVANDRRRFDDTSISENSPSKPNSKKQFSVRRTKAVDLSISANIFFT